MRNVGTAPRGVPIDLRITNESEYRAWNTEWNGIKRVDFGEGSESGYYAAVNLLAPRSPGSFAFWRHDVTWSQLRYSFVDAASGQLTRRACGRARRRARRVCGAARVAQRACSTRWAGPRGAAAIGQLCCGSGGVRQRRFARHGRIVLQ